MISCSTMDPLMAISLDDPRPQWTYIRSEHRWSMSQIFGWSAWLPKDTSFQGPPSCVRSLAYLEIPMPLSRPRLLMQFRPGSYSPLAEQGRLARPGILWHLRRCTYSWQWAMRGITCLAGRPQLLIFVGDSIHGAMQSFVWHHAQRAVNPCPIATPHLAPGASQDWSS